MPSVFRHPWVGVLATIALLAGLLSGAAGALDSGDDFASGITNIKVPNKCRVVQTEMDVIRDTKVTATMLTNLPGTWVESVYPKEANDRLEICLNQAVSTTVRVAWMAHNGDGVQGPPGVSRFYLAEAQGTADAAGVAQVYPACELGDWATGGGFYILGLDAADRPVVENFLSAASLSENHKWNVRIRNLPVGLTVVAEVRCADITP